MGKTPKKAAPGGDERNLYVRRRKATTAPSKASETNSPERQRESESSNRPKLSGIQRRIPTAQAKNLKSKVSALGKVGSDHPRVGRPPQHTFKEGKPSTFLAKAAKGKGPIMQPESEEAEVKLKVSIQEDSNKEAVINKDNKNSKDLQQDNNEATNSKENVEHISNENSSAPKTDVDGKAESKEASQEEQVEIQEEKQDASQTTVSQARESEEHDENDLKLSFDAEESPVISREEKPSEADTKNEKIADEIHSVQEEVKNGTCEKEDLQSESQTDTESYSVDIVESTTSELSEASGSVSQNDIQKEKEKSDEAANNDTSFVTYDSSIMLKDVQIKLNDCLKENTQLFDVSTDEPRSPSQPPRDMSFGKTLRNISGRHSIGRMRHVTLREQRMSPNSSLFVNTSSMSLQPDDTADFRILRYSTGMSDTFSTNGTPMDRKRKHDTESWSTTKKQKTESENSLLHTSISLLKGLRRPVQVSTQSAESYKHQSSKLDLSGLNDDETKIITGPTEVGKKWCVIM